MSISSIAQLIVALEASIIRKETEEMPVQLFDRHTGVPYTEIEKFEKLFLGSVELNKETDLDSALCKALDPYLLAGDRRIRAFKSSQDSEYAFIGVEIATAWDKKSFTFSTTYIERVKEEFTTLLKKINIDDEPEIRLISKLSY